MDLGLQDRVYVVTGASRGLGLATAQALVGEGARVVLCSRDEKALTAAAEDLGGPDKAMAVVADLAEAGSESRLVAAAMGRWERLDGALISVGGPPPGSASLVGDDAWRAAFESVFLGALRVARAVVSTLSDEGGSVAFVLSTSVKQPIDGLAVSNGLRPGLAMAAKTMADELGPRNIRVNGLMPGRIDTDRVRELDQASGRPVSNRREAEARIPLRRYGEPAEFARVAAFLLSPAASYITGTMVPVDGGAIRSL
ncbi:MAG: 3-oxoacyl-[acyl-carrier protein] reductase [Actinomycetota bacterium]|jgi:3-oxoacyl-[acyl-carrier protein] reductase|nr:3-oxoacyl-[acyl-carrier protein] reductase [Actinomycetota bacterium]MDQ1641450.1 3-oxoacyl-[acyl-carrier protein] reductase [Actinomycetota bacterium]